MERILYKEGLENLLLNKTKTIINKYENISSALLLDIGISKYKEKILSENKLYIPELNLNDKNLTTHEILDPNHKFTASRRLVKPKILFEIRIHVPLSGDISLVNNTSILNFKPSYCNSLNKIYIQDGEIILKSVMDLKNDEKANQKIKTTLLNNLIQAYGILTHDIDKYNNDLDKKITVIFDDKKTKYYLQKKIIDDFQIPLKKNKVTKIAVKPTLRTKIKVQIPESNNKFITEPYINEDTYKEIITLIHDSCKNIERMPSLFGERKENDLRDFILFVLDPNFALGSATGETFNNKGKTDIMLKYNSTNIFVAECKIWHGVNEYFKAIDQLLGYLTWRDSKSALIIFVKQIDISGIIKKIEKETEKHKNYISFKNKSTDGVYSFRFNLSTNNKKEISLTVMLYHVNNK